MPERNNNVALSLSQKAIMSMIEIEPVVLSPSVIENPPKKSQSRKHTKA